MTEIISAIIQNPIDPVILFVVGNRVMLTVGLQKHVTPTHLNGSKDFIHSLLSLDQKPSRVRYQWQGFSFSVSRKCWYRYIYNQ